MYSLRNMSHSFVNHLCLACLVGLRENFVCFTIFIMPVVFAGFRKMSFTFVYNSSIIVCVIYRDSIYFDIQCLQYQKAIYSVR